MNPPPAEGLASRLFVGPTLRTQPDRRLVTLVRDGYEAAFEEIVRRYGRPLGRYAAAIVGGRSEDVTQDAFSKALLALRADSEAEIELRPWLYRIVRNTALNDLRDHRHDAEGVDRALAAAGTPSAAEEAERREEIAELTERLRTLPEPQRAAIVMRELEGLSHEEIAAALGTSGGGARQAIHRARIALRDGLGLLVPLPLVRALIDHGAEAGAAAGAGGAAIAAGGAIGGGGVGTALKVGAVTAVLAGGVGTGVAIKEAREERNSATPAAAATGPVPGEAPPPTIGSGGGGSGSGGSGGAADDSGRDSSGRGRGGDDRQEEGRRDEDDREGRGGEDRSGRGDGDDRDAADDGGGGGHSGPGDSGGEEEVGDNSGPGSGSGTVREAESRSGSNSGPGSGDALTEPITSEDNSGSGSGGGDALEEINPDSSGPGSDGSGGNDDFELDDD
jgi:RNA polymerase sigma factor (sigma-70 family)